MTTRIDRNGEVVVTLDFARVVMNDAAYIEDECKQYLAAVDKLGDGGSEG